MAAIQTNADLTGKKTLAKQKSTGKKKLIGASKAQKHGLGSGIRTRVTFVQSSPFILDSELRHGISRYSKLTNLAQLNGDVTIN